MGVGNSTRFKRDAEFLIGLPSRQSSLQKLITKQASRIINTASSFNVLVSIARVGDCNALLCALEVTKQALACPATAAQRDLRRKLMALFGCKATPEQAARCIFTFNADHYSRNRFGRMVIPRLDNSMPFLAAAEEGHWHVILWMASVGVNVLTHDERTGFGVLHAACRGGQPALLEKLMTWDIEVLDDSGPGPLHSSSHRTLDGGAAHAWVDFPAVGRVTPLMVAAYYGKAECVRVLVQAGADISHSLRGGSAIPLPSGSTAMHCAARGGSCQVAVELLKASYTAAGGPMVGTAAGSSMRLVWEGDAAQDLRVQPNNIGVLPTGYACLVRGNVALERMLHPRLPITLVIRQEDPSWTGFDGGVPRLHALALEALRTCLLTSLDAIENEQNFPRNCSPVDCCSGARSQRSPSGGSHSGRLSSSGGSSLRGSTPVATLMATAAAEPQPPALGYGSASVDNLMTPSPSDMSNSCCQADIAALQSPAWHRLDADLGATSTAADTVSESRSLSANSVRMACMEDQSRSQLDRLSASRVPSPLPLPLRQLSVPLPPVAGSSVYARGRAAGSSVLGSSGGTWHAASLYEDHNSRHGHFRPFSSPGGHLAGNGTHSAAANAPLGMRCWSHRTMNDLLQDTVDDAEVQSELDMEWAAYSAQVSGMRHSSKAEMGDDGEAAAAAAAEVEEEGAAAATAAVEAAMYESAPLLSRMMASVDRAATRMLQPPTHTLRSAQRPPSEETQNGGAAAAAALAKIGMQRSLASSLALSELDLQCPICMCEWIEVSVAACGHSMCIECARTLSTSVSKAPVCPLCREAISAFVRVTPLSTM